MTGARIGFAEPASPNGRLPTLRGHPAMRTKKPWMTLVALLAALSLIAAACGDDEEDTVADATEEAGDAATGEEDTETEAGTEAETETEGMTEEDGMTEEEPSGEVAEPVGEACSAIPADGEGSSAGMADDPAGTAASSNPVLSDLVDAATAAELVDALNDPEAEYTIFAPSNDAFAKLDPAVAEGLMTDPEMMEDLTDILTYHVYADGMLDAEALAGEDTLTMLNGDDAEIAAEGDTITINGESMVVCGNVTTANATVHIIDTVLMPPA